MSPWHLNWIVVPLIAWALLPREWKARAGAFVRRVFLADPEDPKK